MNAKLKETALSLLIEGLNRLPVEWQNKFKWMYGRDGGKRSVEDAEAMKIEDVIKEIPDDKLDWAIQQVENSIKKLEKSNECRTTQATGAGQVHH